MTQFTASEVRDYLFSIEERSSRQWLIAHDPELGMLRQFSDLLEAQEKAKPVATVEDQFGFPIMEWIGDAGEKCPAGTNLYTHPAQAQPPAARVPDAVGVSFEVWQDDEMVAECSGPEPSALHEARHYAAQYSQDGAVKLFRVSRVAVSATPQENPHG